MAKSKMMKIVPRESDSVCAFLYARVSTDKQAEEGYSIDIQTERLKAYVTSMFGNGPNVKSELFIDDGYSGASLDRPQMQRMIDLIGSGEGTHVIVYKLDRLSRSQKDTLYLIEDVFLTHNVEFISMQESFNTSTPFGRAVVGILSVFAQFERENIYERTRSGMKKRVEAGYWPGGGGIPFGYDYDAARGILVKNQDADTVKAVYDLYLGGESLQRIANKLGLKYDRLAQQILLRKSNAGYIVYNGEEYIGRHEPIVSLETYEKAVKEFKRRSEAHTYPSSAHLLTGLVRCGVCGAKMRYMKWGKRYKLVCYSQISGRDYLVKDPNCDNDRIEAEALESVILHDLFHLSRDGFTKESAPEVMDTLKVLRNQLSNIEAKIKRLYLIYSDSGDTLLLDTINGLKEERSVLEEKISLETQKGEITLEIDKKLSELNTVSDAWEFYTPEERRNTIRSYINSITVTRDKIAVDYFI